MSLAVIAKLWFMIMRLSSAMLKPVENHGSGLRCLLFVVCCLLFVVCCSLFVVCCSLFVVCFLLFVVPNRCALGINSTIVFQFVALLKIGSH
jgi:hypothetical protein